MEGALAIRGRGRSCNVKNIVKLVRFTAMMHLTCLIRSDEDLSEREAAEGEAAVAEREAAVSEREAAVAVLEASLAEQRAKVGN